MDHSSSGHQRTYPELPARRPDVPYHEPFFVDDPSGRRENLPPRHERDIPPRQQPRAAEPQVFYNPNPTSMSVEVLHREGYDNRGNVDHGRSRDRVQERVGRRPVRLEQWAERGSRSKVRRTSPHTFIIPIRPTPWALMNFR
jgi:hypothetical protein